MKMQQQPIAPDGSGQFTHRLGHGRACITVVGIAHFPFDLGQGTRAVQVDDNNIYGAGRIRFSVISGTIRRCRAEMSRFSVS